MLHKVYTLRRKEVKEVVRKGITYRGKSLVLKTVKNKLPFSRWSFIVPSRVSKEAIERNRLKRLIREGFQKEIRDIKPGFDGIILARATALKQNYKEINKEIDNLLKVSGLKETSDL
ncbi:MAG: ribonuclease P protein component [Candidatus Bathyarchaeota archaeon]|nr:ribonuclease P protein component [Candidatus Bathyarchaeota archaeon]